MVTKYTDLINSLVEQIRGYLILEPVDVVDDNQGSVYECLNWELCNPRTDGSIKIGSANFIFAQQLVISTLHKANDKSPVQTAKIIFPTVLTMLEASRIIRRPPQEKRKEFKVLTNDREERKEREAPAKGS